jgi:hypothetical protein
VLTTISDAIASEALPSHDQPLLMAPACTRTQLTTLKVGSRIHIHATVDTRSAR